MFDLILGTVKGSIQGPILYANLLGLFSTLVICHLLQMENTFLNGIKKLYTTRRHKKALEGITKWLKQSGLKVNEEKTELCIFYKNDVARVTIIINNIQLMYLDYFLT
jgi:hypothetical protein